MYKFTCLGDPGVTYIGKTERNLAVRMDEHLNRERGKSEVTNHIRTCKSCQDGVGYNNFSILKKCDSDYNTSIAEAFLIRRLKPSLNKQAPNQGQSVLLKIF